MTKDDNRNMFKINQEITFDYRNITQEPNKQIQ